jgi:hypothetical protein
LQSKIVIEQPDYGPMKITVLTNGKEKADVWYYDYGHLSRCPRN